MQQKLNRDKLRPDGPLGGMQTFFIYNNKTGAVNVPFRYQN